MLFSTVNKTGDIYGNEFLIKGTVCKTVFTLDNRVSVTVNHVSGYENGIDN